MADGPGDLVRLIVGPGGVVAVDARGGGFGRGAHVHARKLCLEKAVQKGLSRSAKTHVHLLATDGSFIAAESSEGEGSSATEATLSVPSASSVPSVPLNVVSLAGAIQVAMDRRADGLLGTAIRSRQVALGADAVESACQRGESELVVVACDAAAASELTEVRRAVVEGKAIAWGTKAHLGGLSGGPRTDGLAVLAVTSRPIAKALRETVRIAETCSVIARGGQGGHGAGSEGGGSGIMPASEKAPEVSHEGIASELNELPQPEAPSQDSMRVSPDRGAGRAASGRRHRVRTMESGRTRRAGRTGGAVGGDLQGFELGAMLGLGVTRTQPRRIDSEVERGA